MLQADCERFYDRGAPPELTILVFVKITALIQSNLPGLPPGDPILADDQKREISSSSELRRNWATVW